MSDAALTPDHPAPYGARAGSDAAPLPDGLIADYRQVRERSIALVDCLETEDLVVQPMDDASPPKWHLAHTTWFFETFLLRPYLQGYRVFHPRFEYLFNSYYNAVGEQFPRPRRGHLSRPTVAEVRAYRDHVDAAMERLLGARLDGDQRREVAERTVLGLHHEEQHQELLVTDLKYAFGHNPLLPVYARARGAAAGTAAPLRFVEFGGGLAEVGAAAADPGADRHAFVFDNETPRHRHWLEPFALAERCVTAGEFQQFMADGGYERPELWLSDGWNWLQQGGPGAPLYWFHDGDGWWEYTLAGARPVDPHAPVCHVSFYEVDAYARWAGYRLPTEAEWECAAAQTGADGTFMEDAFLHPQPAQAAGLAQMRGDVWEWTASPYAAYPGYRPLPGALAEYNGKFMCNQLVLRGGSCATPRDHVRTTYRNFFYAPDRWQFTGVRLAADL